MAGQKARRNLVNSAACFRCAETLRCGAIDLVAVDMPLSRSPITGRRDADQKISREFGGRGAAVHSPTKDRPGDMGQALCHAFADAGFALATTCGEAAAQPSIIEVFPLAALVSMMRLDRRPPYKAGKTAAYWRGIPLEERRRRLVAQWRAIVDFLKTQIEDFDFLYPAPTEGPPLSRLKPYEDALDAIICALAGSYVLDGCADAFDDGQAAIFVPRPQ